MVGRINGQRYPKGARGPGSGSTGKTISADGSATPFHPIEVRSDMTGLSDPVILIVDPDVLNATAVAALLHLHRHDVYSVETSQQALAAAAELPVDMLICEQAVGHSSGVELVREIHGLRGREDVPAMFMTRHQPAGIERRVHSFGPAWHLKKPVDAKVLIELVEQTLLLPQVGPAVPDRPHFPVSRPAAGRQREGRRRAGNGQVRVDPPVGVPVGVPISSIHVVQPPHLPISTPITSIVPSTA